VFVPSLQKMFVPHAFIEITHETLVWLPGISIIKSDPRVRLQPSGSVHTAFRKQSFA
jgi:hypothetical protein